MSFDVKANLRSKGYMQDENGMVVKISESHDFMAVCREYASANKVSLASAIKTLAKENPALHRSWLLTCRP